jgi:competence protein ComFC
MMNFAKWWTALFPVTCTCLFCDTPLAAHRFTNIWQRLCIACTAQLHRIDGAICQVCGRVSNQEKTNVCGDCSAVQQVKWVYNRSVFAYTAFVKQLVWRYKYKGLQRLAKPLGLLMAETVDHYWRKQKFVLSYVPLHRDRLQERGFNQAALLAQMIGKHLRLPVVPLLMRRRATPQQSSKGRDERLHALHDAFSLREDVDVTQLAEHSILLVDDIYTTGTTIRECAKPLKRRGIENVYSITIAR